MGLLFDHWECSEIVAVNIEDGVASLYIASPNNPLERGGRYLVPINLFSEDDRKIVEELANDRPLRF